MTDEEVRAAMKTVIATADAAAVIWPYNCLSHDLDEWPGLFGADRHGWIIKRSAIEAEWKHGGRDRAVWIYDIWGFYGFRTGKEDDNSDDEWAAIIDAVRDGFRAAPTLELAEVERHDLLQVAANTTINCGEETLHFAQCRVRVHICC